MRQSPSTYTSSLPSALPYCRCCHLLIPPAHGHSSPPPTVDSQETVTHSEMLDEINVQFRDDTLCDYCLTCNFNNDYVCKLCEIAVPAWSRVSSDVCGSCGAAGKEMVLDPEKCNRIRTWFDRTEINNLVNHLEEVMVRD